MKQILTEGNMRTNIKKIKDTKRPIKPPEGTATRYSLGNPRMPVNITNWPFAGVNAGKPLTFNMANQLQKILASIGITTIINFKKI